MTLKFFTLFFSIITLLIGSAQEIPRKMLFADMELKIEDDAAEIIRTRMKKLTANTKFFTGLKNKFELHAPLIQKALAENQVPDEFKFLCLMESSLNPAAVSTSNAVGYWQFKKESGIEVGLRIDHEIDERKNIVASTIAASKYLKRSNAVLNNWVLTCQSYNVGLGGTRRSVDNALFGEKKMTIDSRTHEYVIKFLAYILLFKQNQASSAPTLTLLEYKGGQNKTLDEIATQTELNKEDLKSYNLWLTVSRIPNDRIYPVILPIPADRATLVMQKLNIKANEVVAETTIKTPKQEEEEDTKPSKKKWWQIFSDKDEDQLNGTDVPVFIDINGIRAIQAKPGDNSHKLANQGEIRYKRFLRFNEMRTFDELIPGKFYYLDAKKSDASVLFHIVMPNESLWDIAQKYGITTESIKDKNRMDDGEALALGRKLYLRFNRPENEPMIVEKIQIPEAPRDTVVLVNQQVIRDTVVKIDTVFHKAAPKDPSSQTAKEPQVLENKRIEELDKEPENQPKSIENVYHTVEQGQTMYFISRKYGTAIDSIRSWNQLQDNGLKIGSALLVKKGKPVSAVVTEKKQVEPVQNPVANGGNIQHIVQSKETLYGISKKYGVNVSSIIELNHLEGNALKLGMVLEIPKR